MPPRSSEQEERDKVSEGAAFKGVAQPGRRMPAAIAMAAIAIVGVALLSRGQSTSVPSTPEAVVVPQPAPAATVIGPDGAPAALAPTIPPLADRIPAVTPLTTVPPVPAMVGLNELVPAGESPVRLTVSLPDGWTKVTNSTFARSEGAGSPISALSAWSLMHVNVFPCRWSAEIFADDDLMRTPGGQADALASWWGQDPGMPANSNAAIAPLASEPERTTLGGYPAWYLEVLIPRRLDLAQCDGGELILWHAATGEARRSLGPGELSSIWVVDVDGEPIVVDLAIFPDQVENAEELEAIVASIAVQS